MYQLTTQPMLTEHDQSDEPVEFEAESSDDTDEYSIEEAESTAADKIKQFKERFKRCDEEKRQALEDLQRAKADFLNTKKRLEAERAQTKELLLDQHIENLLPLCDSFNMAMSNTEVWETVDATWRTGVEGIHTQLQNVLQEYGVVTINPIGETFDPQRHEAATNQTVTEPKQHNVIQAVVQLGYVRKTIDGTRLIRPARVAVGNYEK